MKNFIVCGVLIFGFLNTAFASQVRGRVAVIEEGYVLIRLDEDVKVTPGSPVLIGFDVPGVGFVQMEGDWRVDSYMSGGTIRVKPLQENHQRPKPGYIAEIEIAAESYDGGSAVPDSSETADELELNAPFPKTDSETNPFAGTGWEPIPSETPQNLYSKGLALIREGKDSAARKQGLGFLLQAAGQNHSGAMFEAGLAYARGRGTSRDYVRAASWFEKASAMGNAGAQFNLGYMYYAGVGIPGNDAKAMHYLMLAAKQDIARAQSLVGELFQTGRGTSVNYREAAHWYQQAADKNDFAGINNLGVMYRQGWGVDQNYQKAIRLFMRGAELGDDMALYNLGYAHQHGLGMTVDADKAVSYYKKAAGLGNAEAQKRLAELGH